MKLPFKVVCINSTGLPDLLPIHQRIIEGQVYTVTEIAHMKLQSLVGYRLAEIASSFPYEFFKASRFRPLDEVEAEVNVNELEQEITI
jgi:hypothetical protein